MWLVQNVKLILVANINRGNVKKLKADEYTVTSNLMRAVLMFGLANN